MHFFYAFLLCMLDYNRHIKSDTVLLDAIERYLSSKTLYYIPCFIMTIQLHHHDNSIASS